MGKKLKIEELIRKYPLIFETYPGNPNGINWYGLPEGWTSVVDKLCGSIQRYIDEHVSYTKDGEYRPAQVTCTQLKEKYGGLRFYTNGHDEVVEGMINMAE